MDVGLYIAAQGMLAEQTQQNTLSNNLSNASTPGYKTQSTQQKSFDQLLLENTTTGQTIGSINAGVDVSKIVTNTDPGSIENTNQPLDFAINGEGYFAVKTSAGVRYTQDGQFQANAQGQLTDSAGDPVLTQSGQPITVSSSGTVDASQLGVFNLSNVNEQGNNLITGTVAGKATGIVKSGELEQSSTDSISTMTDMIASLRSYQAGQSAIQSIDKTLQENASSVASVEG